MALSLLPLLYPILVSVYKQRSYRSATRQGDNFPQAGLLHRNPPSLRNRGYNFFGSVTYFRRMMSTCDGV